MLKNGSGTVLPSIFCVSWRRINSTRTIACFIFLEQRLLDCDIHVEDSYKTEW